MDPGAQHAADELTGLLYLRHGEHKIHTFSLATPDNDTSRLQHGDVLRKICFRDAEFFLKFSGDPIAPAQEFENVKTGRIGESLAHQLLLL